MICRICKKEKNYRLFHLGEERFHIYYCSIECLEKDGKEVCPICQGMGWHYHFEEESSCQGFIENENR